MLNLPTQHPTDYRALRVTRATLIKITLSQNSIVLRAFPTTQLPDEPGIPSLKTPSICNARELNLPFPNHADALSAFNQLCQRWHNARRPIRPVPKRILADHQH